MKDTGFVVPREKRDRLAACYQWSNEEGRLIPYTDNHLGLEGYGEDVVYESGGAGLVSTVDDYAKFARMMMHYGTLDGVRILGRKTVELMTSSHLTREQAKDFNWDSLWGYDYGFLTRVLRNPGEAGCNASVGEYGWDGWLGVYFANFPAEEMTILMMMQIKDTGTACIQRRIRNVLLALESQGEL